MSYQKSRPIVYGVAFVFLSMMAIYHYNEENWFALAVNLALMMVLTFAFYYFNKKRKGPEKTWRSYDP